MCAAAVYKYNRPYPYFNVRIYLVEAPRAVFGVEAYKNNCFYEHTLARISSAQKETKKNYVQNIPYLFYIA